MTTKLIKLFILCIVLFYVSFVSAHKYDDDTDHKITICHVPPGNPANAHTISIDYSALQTHLNHGDYIGECNTPSPTLRPSKNPTKTPSLRPTNNPTTKTPTNEPTNTPTNKPTNTPTNKPTNTPMNEPTNTPTNEPTNTPTLRPTNTPTNEPTNTPTKNPTKNPTNTPTNEPTNKPTNTPTTKPTNTPTKNPTNNIVCDFDYNKRCSYYATSVDKCSKDKSCYFARDFRFQPCDKREWPCDGSSFGDGNNFGVYMECSPSVIQKYSKTASINGCIVLKKQSFNKAKPKPALLGCETKVGGCYRLLNSVSDCQKADSCMAVFKSDNKQDFYCIEVDNAKQNNKNLKNVYVDNYLEDEPERMVSFNCQNLPNGACTGIKVSDESFVYSEEFPCASSVGLAFASNAISNFDTATVNLVWSTGGFIKQVAKINYLDICGRRCCPLFKTFRFPANDFIGMCKLQIVSEGTVLFNPASPYY
jgi:hypothetical protein